MLMDSVHNDLSGKFVMTSSNFIKLSNPLAAEFGHQIDPSRSQIAISAPN